MALPAEVAIDLDLTGAKGGTYLLMRVGSFAGETEFVPGTFIRQGGKKVTIYESNGVVYADVVPPGMMLIIK